MAMRTGSTTEAADATGLSYTSVMELVETVSIPEFSAERDGFRWTVRWDDSIDSPTALLAAWVASRGGRLRNEDLPVYMSLRRKIGNAQKLNHSPELLKCYSEGRATVSGIAIARDLGGTPAVVHDALDFLSRYRGEPDPFAGRRRPRSKLSLDEFLIGHAPVLRGLPCTVGHPAFSAYRAPKPTELGRAAAMGHEDNVILAGLALIACPTQLGPSCIHHSLSIVERLDLAAGGGSLADLATMLEALRIRFIVNAERSTAKTLKNDRSYYDWTRRALDRWLDGLPAAIRKRFRRHMMPPIPADVAAHVELLVAAEEQDEEETEEAGGGEGRSPPKSREVQAERVSRERVSILSRMETRWFAFEESFGKLKSELAAVQAALDRGEPVSLPVPVAHTWPVIRPDGSPGVGRQTMLAEIDTASNLWRRCAAVDARGGVVRPHLSLLDRRGLLARSEPTIDGRDYDPADEDRLCVLYHGTMPCGPGGESHECWLIPIMRSGVLYGYRQLETDQVDGYHQMRRSLGLSDTAALPTGMLRFEKQRDVSLAATCRRLLGAELLPVVPAIHGAMIGRVSVRAELLNGLRVGATCQARDDDGCFTAAKVRGKLVFYMSAVMKGDGIDTLRPTVMDAVTVNLFERIRLMWLERFNGGVDELLPAFKYANVHSKPVPSAGFLLSGRDAALMIDEINMLIAVMLAGIIDTTSHPLKYGFAAMIKEAGATPRQLNVACHHEIGSEVSEAYARFGDDPGIEELISEAHDMMEQDQQLYRLMELT